MSISFTIGLNKEKYQAGSCSTRGMRTCLTLLSMPLRKAAVSIRTCEVCTRVSGICTARTPPFGCTTFFMMFGNNSLCPVHQCNAALLNTTSCFSSLHLDSCSAVPIRHESLSLKSDLLWSATARSIISALKSNPLTLADGKVRHNSSVMFPVPQPKSRTDFTLVTSPMAQVVLVKRSTAGRIRADPNFKYCVGFQAILKDD
mmetsp:Transcript_1597/g.2608  ORF Transcript_1597/g.2608 Transcript_1597/m.2608 type:complete len:202 (-) Transcript_1597:35-640(-)